MKAGLFASTFAKLVCGFVMLALLLFLPAGTMHYPHAWLLMGILFLPMTVVGAFLLFKNPELLKKRMQTREQEDAQRRVILLSLLMFIAGFILAGLDFRFGWSRLPRWLVIAASAVFLLGYAAYAEVLRENAYLSRTVEVQKDQKVIDTGLYALVRHPMYAATVLMFLSMPIVLGSLPAFVVFLPYPLLIAARIRNEEAVLTAGLPGYREYLGKVKYRLIPFIW